MFTRNMLLCQLGSISSKNRDFKDVDNIFKRVTKHSRRFIKVLR